MCYLFIFSTPTQICHSLTWVLKGCPHPLSASPDMLHSPDYWPHNCSHSSGLSRVFTYLIVFSGHHLCASTARDSSWEQNKCLELSSLWRSTMLPACPSVRKNSHLEGHGEDFCKVQRVTWPDLGCERISTSSSENSGDGLNTHMAWVIHSHFCSLLF